jgi:hypothetical protein
VGAYKAEPAERTGTESFQPGHSPTANQAKGCGNAADDSVSLSLSVYFPLFTCIPLFLSVQSDSIEILSLSLSGSKFLLRQVRMDPNTPYHKNVPIKTISYYKMHVRHFHLLGKRYYSGACSSMNLLTSVS